jgi:hypothetical protein
MHGPMNVKFIRAKQAKETYRYSNIKGKLYKTSAAIWYNKICKEKQLTTEIYYDARTYERQMFQLTVSLAL